MILARRIVALDGDGSTAAPAYFGKDFPFFKFVPIRICVGLIIVYGELLSQQRPQRTGGDDLTRRVVAWHQFSRESHRAPQ